MDVSVSETAIAMAVVSHVDHVVVVDLLWASDEHVAHVINVDVARAMAVVDQTKMVIIPAHTQGDSATELLNVSKGPRGNSGPFFIIITFLRHSFFF